MRAMHHAGREALAHLVENGETSAYADRIATWEERQALFHLPEFTAAEAHFDHVQSDRPVDAGWEPR